MQSYFEIRIKFLELNIFLYYVFVIKELFIYEEIYVDYLF